MKRCLFTISKGCISHVPLTKYLHFFLFVCAFLTIFFSSSCDRVISISYHPIILFFLFFCLFFPTNVKRLLNYIIHLNLASLYYFVFCVSLLNSSCSTGKFNWSRCCGILWRRTPCKNTSAILLFLFKNILPYCFYLCFVVSTHYSVNYG